MASGSAMEEEVLSHPNDSGIQVTEKKRSADETDGSNTKRPALNNKSSPPTTPGTNEFSDECLIHYSKTMNDFFNDVNDSFVRMNKCKGGDDNTFHIPAADFNSLKERFKSVSNDVTQLFRHVHLAVHSAGQKKSEPSPVKETPNFKPRLTRNTVLSVTTRLDNNLTHFPTARNSLNNYCQVCYLQFKKKVKKEIIQCEDCKVHICVDHYKLFHTERHL
mmetsp:Transcript_8865/g.11709  ORF Transcript_8865/g.11709 Transcript_8865/m.11709 type:complete len:219 (+) Transcript_8865:143-799(+)